MANHKSAIKRHRQSLKRRARNRSTKREVLTLTKRLLEASKEEAPKLFKTLQSKLEKAGRRHVLNRKKVSRLVSKANKVVASK